MCMYEGVCSVVNWRGRKAGESGREFVKDKINCPGHLFFFKKNQ